MRTPALVLLVALAFGSGSASAQGFDIAWNVCGGGPVEKVLDCSDVAGPDIIVVTFRPSVPIVNFFGLEAELCITNLDGPLPDFWQFGAGGCNEGLLGVSGTGAGVTCLSPWGNALGAQMAYETPDAGNPNRARVHIWATRSGGGGGGTLAAGTEYLGFRLQIFHDNASVCGGCDAPVIITLNSVTLRSRSCPSGSIGTEHVAGVIRTNLIAVNHGVLASTSAPLTLGLVGARVNPVAGRDLVVDFSLPDGSPAWIELLDISGRRVARQEVGTLGPGLHFVRMTEASGIRPGVYHLRLVNDSAARVRKTVILQ